jgi:hypothetical protein
MAYGLILKGGDGQPPNKKKGGDATACPGGKCDKPTDKPKPGGGPKSNFFSSKYGLQTMAVDTAKENQKKRNIELKMQAQKNRELPTYKPKVDSVVIAKVPSMSFREEETSSVVSEKPKVAPSTRKTTASKTAPTKPKNPLVLKKPDSTTSTKTKTYYMTDESGVERKITGEESKKYQSEYEAKKKAGTMK